MEINFIPVFNDEPIVEATKEYAKIWEEDGEKIIKTLESHTGLEFKEKRIGAVVYGWMSQSGNSPWDVMKLRWSNTPDRKRGALVHELGHRILFGVKAPEEMRSNGHYMLYLFLYDVFESLYGKEFAEAEVQHDREKGEKFPDRKFYIEAWEWSLKFTREERKQKFAQVIEKTLNTS